MHGLITATRLPRHCSGPACSQPASWYRPTAYCHTDQPIAWAHRSKSVGLHTGSFRKMSLFS